MPQVVTTIDDIRKAVRQARGAGLTVGLVPTMGALHEGHASLLRAARLETGFVVATIFVNPTQFGPNEDFQHYPRTLEADLLLCGHEGIELVFVPEPSTLYPAGFNTYVEVHELQSELCGASRPGHFRGVATVVLKLFNIVQPDVAYFGQKDAQQARIVQQMVRDLDLPVHVRTCPIVREKDGLALSSRNRYLAPEQRRQAVVLFRALTEGQAMIDKGERDVGRVQRHMAELIETAPGATLDYAAVVDADTLQVAVRFRGKILLALAVRFGSTRLIDNLLVEVAD